ncbi:Alpha/Beta hydrolase protein, partial [Endogone sp. FLAS-F59071]
KKKKKTSSEAITLCHTTVLYRSKFPDLQQLSHASTYRCNIPYTHPATRSQTLDLYLPHPPASSHKTSSTDPGARRHLYPIVVFVYGGSWSSGNKSLYVGLANTLREMGYIVVVPDYRKYPQVRAEEMYEDIRSVLEWVGQNVAIDEIGGHREQIYVMGHSAGAQLASYVVLQDMLNQARAYQERDAVANGVAVTANAEKSANGDANGMRPLPRVEGLILCAGVYDINEHYRWEAHRGVEQISAMGRAMGANPTSFAHNSPHHLVTSSPELFVSAPMLLVLPRVLFVHGERDTTVPVASTLQMYTALGEVIPVDRRDEVDIRMRLYKRMDHAECVTALMPNYIFPSRFRRSLMRDLQDFIDVEFDS